MNLEKEIEESAIRLYGRKPSELSKKELYFTVLDVTKELLAVTENIESVKRIYYVSAEFLTGKLFRKNLLNLGIYDNMDEILKKYGSGVEEMVEQEPEPSLGNGGLGRLAACYLDSMATLGIAGEGVGILYHLGLFKQVFKDRLQCSEPDPWIEEHSWLRSTGLTFDVDYADRSVKARHYTIDVPGYHGRINRLNLFDVDTADESIVKSGIDFDKTDIEKGLTLFLYPDDSDEEGNLLRIYQEYFLASCASQLILSEMKEQKYDLAKLYDHAVVQINDTHPTLIIPELIRKLVEDKAFSMDEAVDIVTKTCAYTNHTIMAEALEKWPLKYIQKVVPALVPYIKELDKRIRKKYKDETLQIIDKDKRVHMAHIDIHYGYSVNGVASIHTDILKETELKEFNDIYPGKFSNKTNGITFRRWLYSCNMKLDSLIAETIGEGYRKDAGQLEKLLAYKDDPAFLEKLDKIKRENKEALAATIYEREGIRIDPDTVFDIQSKRLHEYKRQQMNVLDIIRRYQEIKSGKLPERPVTFIFGAKAAPAYVIARDIIHLILVMQDIINNDPVASKYIKVIMVTNYNVSYAEKMIPACDISEQISLASKEASGTGNMKFMLNGAVTLGTLDGANVEIRDLVGDDNIYIFGADAATVIDHYKNEDYVSEKLYKADPVIKASVDFITGPAALKLGHAENLKRLKKELVGKDYFMTLLDLKDYMKTRDRVIADYSDRDKWLKMSLTNIAKAGFFSSDRSIRDYNRDIWKIN
ncbi:MAG: glycogen/starch/alpha-glucan family phosphorylase [Lachnospiraceae bacterium]|nr:glycogen/starch/alpha-glucan family phosphorylase [Lachnospiraceae bacterium]